MKKKLLLVYVFIAFIVLCTNVYAVVTMDLNLVTDNLNVEPGSDLLVTVNLEKISAPISSIQGYINIDENVIEAITEEIIVNSDGKIEVKSENEVPNNLSYAFNPSTTNADYDVIFNTKKENIENNDCFFVMDLSNDIETSADILNLKFKIKDNATIKTVSDAVKVDCVVAYSAETDDKTEEISAALDIKVVEDAANAGNNEDNKDNEDNADKDENTTSDENENTNTDENTNTNSNTDSDNDKNTNENTNTNNNTNKNTNTNTNSNSSTDTTVAGTTIPQAGSFLIIIPIIVFAVLAYVSYNRYIKYKDV